MLVEGTARRFTGTELICAAACPVGDRGGRLATESRPSRARLFQSSSGWSEAAHQLFSSVYAAFISLWRFVNAFAMLWCPVVAAVTALGMSVLDKVNTVPGSAGR